MNINEIIGKVSRDELRSQIKKGAGGNAKMKTLFARIRRDWDKHRYDEIFGPNKYRLSIPVSINREIETNNNSEPDERLVKWLEERGYKITSYGASALAVNDRGREMRIGKIIGDKNPEMKHIFDTDPARAGTQARKKNYYAVISRSPTDIMQMATGIGLGFKSCMNLESGVNRKYVPLDVKYGTLIAFLVREGDTKIQSPISRILIKPFFGTTDGKLALGVSNNMYNLNIPEFRETIVDWADRINGQNGLQGDYVLQPKLYNDLDGDDYIKNDPYIRLSNTGARTAVHVSELDNHQLTMRIRLLNRVINAEERDEVEKRLDDFTLVTTALYNVRDNNGPNKWPAIEREAISNPNYASMYAACVVRKRWPRGEPVILTDLNAALSYHEHMFGTERWPAFERVLKPIIANDPSLRSFGGRIYSIYNERVGNG